MAADHGRDAAGPPEGPESARAAGLRYLTDAVPGITRRRAGKGFSYRAPDGAPVRDADELVRIRRLAIPPAWTDVWISPDPRGHLQATGRDARGRKQYRYHPDWRAVRDESKYGRLLAFGAALPALRAQVEQDLALPGLPPDRVLAATVRLLDETLIRVGNQEYARRNGSFGLTTLHDEHVAIEGSRLRFSFPGKGGREHEVEFRDRRLANVVKRCQEVPGYQLFQYRTAEGGRAPIESSDVNDYLRRVTGQEFTAKDFRTWGGTVLAAETLVAMGPFSTPAQARRNVVAAVKEVARHLRNTPAVCRACYIHPDLIEAYEDGTLLERWNRWLGVARAHPKAWLDAEEDAVLRLLRLTEEQRGSGRAGAG